MSEYPIKPGEWPGFRRDPGLSGHQPLPGIIKKPRVAWSHYLGGSLYDAFPIGHRHARTLLILFGGCVHNFTPSLELVWKSKPLGIESIVAVEDVDNDGVLEILASNGKTIFLLSSESGDALWQEYLGPPNAAGFMHTGAFVHHFPEVGHGFQLVVGLLSSREVVLYDFSPGATKPERRHILWMDDYFHPTVLAFDIDGDGRDEIVVTKYSAIYVFDPVTGQEKSSCHWSSGGSPKRNYGLFQACDIFDAGQQDLVVLSDRVSKHIAVVRNRAGTLEAAWDRFVEHIYPDDLRELRYVHGSVSDVNGDGRLEIVVSIFNENGDGRWWLEVLDAATGESIVRYPDGYLRGVQASVSASRRLIFVSIEKNREPDGYGECLILECEGEKLSELFAMSDAAFAGRFLRRTDVRAVFRTEPPPSDDVWCVQVDGATSVALVRGQGFLMLLDLEPGGGFNLTPVPGAFGVIAVIAVEDLDNDSATEIAYSTSEGIIRIVRADGSELGRTRCGISLRYGTGPYYMAKPMQVPVVATLDDGSICAVPGPAGQILALKSNGIGTAPEMVFSRPGKGRMGPEESHHSVLIEHWSGQRGILMTGASGGTACIRFVDSNGGEIATWPVPIFPVNTSAGNPRLGIYDFQFAGNDSDRTLFVSGFQSRSMNSEISLGLNPESGEIEWERRTVGEGEDGRGFGPWQVVSLRPDSDIAEIAFLAKDTVCFMNGTSGRLLGEPWQLRPFNTAHLARRGMSMDDFAAYGALIYADLDGPGSGGWCITGCYGGVGAIDADRKMRWWLSAPLSSLTGSLAGVADVDGDGLPEIGISYADGDFVCLRADTGEEKWRIDLGVAASGIVTCDIDGDGRVEYITATQQGELLAIGVSRNGCGIVKWRLQFDYALGQPIAVDFDRDGYSEILVVCGDGQLYSIVGER